MGRKCLWDIATLCCLEGTSLQCILQGSPRIAKRIYVLLLTSVRSPATQTYIAFSTSPVSYFQVSHYCSLGSFPKINYLHAIVCLKCCFQWEVRLRNIFLFPSKFCRDYSIFKWENNGAPLFISNHKFFMIILDIFW